MDTANLTSRALAAYLQEKCERDRDLELDKPVGDKVRGFVHRVVSRMADALGGVGPDWRLALDVQGGGKRGLLVLDDGHVTATAALSWSDKLLTAKAGGQVALMGADARRRVVRLLAEIVGERMGVLA